MGQEVDVRIQSVDTEGRVQVVGFRIQGLGRV